jgi:hypothetical protein
MFRGIISVAASMRKDLVSSPICLATCAINIAYVVI